ncbi:hypothetical protein C8R44DRAFT_959132, partial [Mycena epipterygia]
RTRRSRGSCTWTRTSRNTLVLARWSPTSSSRTSRTTCTSASKKCAGGQVVDLASVPSLEVTVFATPLTLPPGADFPVPGERRHHGGIAHGRTGGSRDA